MKNTFLHTLSNAMQNNWAEIMKNKIDQCENIVIFGANGAGVGVSKWLTKAGVGGKIKYYCDSNLQFWGKNVQGIEIIDPSRLNTFDQSKVLIALADYYAGSKPALALERMGYKNYVDFFPLFHMPFYETATIFKRLYELEKVYKLLVDAESQESFLHVLEHRITGNPFSLKIADYPQYFHPIVGPRLHDTIIDAGSYDGDIAFAFARHVEKKCKIYAFEPSDDSFKKLQQGIIAQKLEEFCFPVKSGLWRTDANMNMDGAVGGCDQISTEGNFSIKVTGLDQFIEKMNIRPNMIKMDIEGSESDALLGGINHIGKYKPRLQICVYHKPDDLWKLPRQILDINPKYKFYLGHHYLTGFDSETWNRAETVLYAI